MDNKKMTTKVKIISDSEEVELQLKINQFIEDKEIIDIKFSEAWTSDVRGFTALIIYKQEKKK